MYRFNSLFSPYASVDDDAAIVERYLLSQILNLPSAFSLWHANFELLGFKFYDKHYFDKMMPFGASISCAT